MGWPRSPRNGRHLANHQRAGTRQGSRRRGLDRDSQERCVDLAGRERDDCNRGGRVESVILDDEDWTGLAGMDSAGRRTPRRRRLGRRPRARRRRPTPTVDAPPGQIQVHRRREPRSELAAGLVGAATRAVGVGDYGREPRPHVTYHAPVRTPYLRVHGVQPVPVAVHSPRMSRNRPDRAPLFRTRRTLKDIPLQELSGTERRHHDGPVSNPLVAGSSPARPTSEAVCQGQDR